MGGSSVEVEFEEFHLQSLKTIAEINSRYPRDPNFFGMFGFIKAKTELEDLVNLPARKYGIQYDLDSTWKSVVPEIMFKSSRRS